MEPGASDWQKEVRADKKLDRNDESINEWKKCTNEYISARYEQRVNKKTREIPPDGCHSQSTGGEEVHILKENVQYCS